MKKTGLLGIMILSTALLAAETASPLRVAVAEFEMRNDIGMDNAGAVVSELLISSLKGFGKYRINERVLLKKVLAEQELQLSALGSGDPKAIAGKIEGLDAIVLGSIMKVGDSIGIYGRLADIRSGKILTESRVEFSNIKDIEEKAEELAFYLCGNDLRSYREMLDKRSIDRVRLGFLLGGGYALSLNQYSNVGFSSYGFDVLFKSRNIEADCGFVFAFEGGQYFVAKGGLQFYPWPNIGFGALAVMHNDGITHKANDEGRKLGTYLQVANEDSLTTLYIGIACRLTSLIRVGLYYGGTLNGQVTFWENGSAVAKYEVNSFKNTSPIPLNVAASAEVILFDSWTLHAFYFITNETTKLKSDSSGSAAATMPYSFQQLQLTVGYSFGL